MQNQSNLYGLIGHPLSHSFSKKYFSDKFTKEQIFDCYYELFPIEKINELPDLLHTYPTLRGLNVTIPYKESVLPYLDQVSEPVSQIRACNCIKIDQGKLIGHNTDVLGFEMMLLPHLKSHHKRALILGTGGAAKAVAWVLHNLGISYSYVSRSPGDKTIYYAQLNKEELTHSTLIVNTTPLGMSPHTDECPDIPYQFISKSHLCVDLIYNPSITKFLALSQQKGAAILNGMEMLIIQAEESWKIWNH